MTAALFPSLRAPALINPFFRGRTLRHQLPCPQRRPSLCWGFHPYRESVSLLDALVSWLREPTRFVERSEEHTSELQSRSDLVCRLLLEKKKKHLTTYSSI